MDQYKLCHRRNDCSRCEGSATCDAESGSSRNSVGMTGISNRLFTACALCQPGGWHQNDLPPFMSQRRNFQSYWTLSIAPTNLAEQPPSVGGIRTGLSNRPQGPIAV